MSEPRLDSGAILREDGVQAAMVPGIALANLVRFEQSAGVLLAAGDAAERLGWLVRATRGFDESGKSAYRGSTFAAAQSAWECARSLYERRGNRAGAADTLGSIGIVYESLGDHAKALSAQERALGARVALGDRAGAAATLGNMGNVYESLGDHPPWLVEGLGVLFGIYASAAASAVSPVVERVLVRPPRSFEAFVRAHRAEFA
jgi:hypothetical protein